jgi:hypothetical protein
MSEAKLWQYATFAVLVVVGIVALWALLTWAIAAFPWEMVVEGWLLLIEEAGKAWRGTR